MIVQVSKQRIKDTSNMQWTFPLSSSGNMLAISGSVIVIASHQEVSAVDDKGQLLWCVQLDELENDGYPPQLFGFQDCVAHYASGQITTFEKSTGEILYKGSLSPFSYGTSLEQTHLILSRSATRNSPAYLWCKSALGEVLWKLSVGSSLLSLPLVINDLILVSDGISVWGIDAEGKVLWTADKCGLKQGTKAPLLSEEECEPRIVAISTDSVVATLNTQEKYLLNTSAPAISRLPVQPTDEVLGRLPSGDRIVWRGSYSQDYSGGPCQWPILATNLEGEVLWRFTTTEKPKRLVTDNSSFYLIFTPEYSYWKKYGHWYELPCQIQRFSLRGELIATWQFDSPVGVVKSSNNNIYVLSGSILYTLDTE